MSKMFVGEKKTGFSGMSKMFVGEKRQVPDLV